MISLEMYFYLYDFNYFQELKLDHNRLASVPSSSLNGPESLRMLFLKNNRIGTYLQLIKCTLHVTHLTSNLFNHFLS